MKHIRSDYAGADSDSVPPSPTTPGPSPSPFCRVRLQCRLRFGSISELPSAAVPRHQVHHVEESIKTCKLPKFACTHEAHMYKQATAPCVLRDPASKQQPTTRPWQGQDDTRGLITSQHANYSTRPRTKLSHVSFFIYSGYYSYATVAISSSLNVC